MISENSKHWNNNQVKSEGKWSDDQVTCGSTVPFHYKGKSRGFIVMTLNETKPNEKIIMYSYDGAPQEFKAIDHTQLLMVIFF